MEIKPKVFVVTPFNEDFLALYAELKRVFGEKFDFTNAGDLDNQQNILQDIVEGIYYADVVIADLTGLNANVFYELGLAHAMNKKVIIITQDINELPFDIKSYRANEYSLQFNKLPALINELEKLLNGAIDNDIKYGNPISDYIPNFFIQYNHKEEDKNTKSESLSDAIDTKNGQIAEETEDGYLDYISNIEDSSAEMTKELESMAKGMEDMTISVQEANEDMNRAKESSGGNSSATYVRNICRKLANPIEDYAEKVKGHVTAINYHWALVENGYLSLLDNNYMTTGGNLDGLKQSISSLRDLKDSISVSNNQIDGFINTLKTCLGAERRLNRSLNLLIYELEGYLSMTETMYASIDRIISKSEVVITS